MIHTGSVLPKVIKPLTSAQVKALKVPGWTAVGGVPGLYIQLKGDSAKSWILRATIKGRRTIMGLGPYSLVTLAEAREEAFRRLRLIQQRNFVAAMNHSLKSPSTPSFSDCANQFLESKQSEWSNPKSLQQWKSTLQNYVAPILGKTPIDQIVTKDIVRVLRPHWESKTDTMTKLRGRIENIIDWASTYGYRDTTNPARWQGNLEYLLPSPAKIAGTRHHRSLPYKDAPNAFKSIQNMQGIGARCLELIILTAVRSGEARKAVWAEIDLSKRIWRIPADRMKMRKDFEIPLCQSALATLDGLPRFATTDFVFPGKSGQPITDMTVLQVLRRSNIPCVVHGFRSTFSTWCAEQTDTPREVREMSLAHKIGTDVELAYMRGDLMLKRRSVMEKWEHFLTV